MSADDLSRQAAELLAEEDYTDRPLCPVTCDEDLSQEGRVNLYRWRVSLGYNPFHPDDCWQKKSHDGRAAHVLRTAANGAAYAAEVTHV